MRRFYLVDIITVKDFSFLKDCEFSKEDEVRFLFRDDNSKVDFKYLYEINNKVKYINYMLYDYDMDKKVFSYKLSTTLGILCTTLYNKYDEFIIYSNIKELEYSIDTLNGILKENKVKLIAPNLEPTGLFIEDSIMEYLGLNNTEIVYPCRDALLLSKNLQDFHNRLAKIFGRENGREYYLKLRPLYKTITNLG